MSSYALLPSNAVEIAGTRTFTTSMMIADVFGKLHKNVLRDIDNLDCSPEFHGTNFGLMLRETNSRPDVHSSCGLKVEPTCGVPPTSRFGSREERYFNISRDGFTFLAMGYRGKKAAQFKEAYIRRFNEMEDALRHPRIPARTRFLATHDGTAWWLKEIPENAFIMPAEDWPKVIKTADFPTELLPSVLSAVSERIQSLPTPQVEPRAYSA